MKQDSWIGVHGAQRRLHDIGYVTEVDTHHLHYRRQGVSGRITIRPGSVVDEWVIFRLEDRGS